jgi:hypothetical protein
MRWLISGRMPRRPFKTCKRCGRSSDEVGVLSRTRLCQECGDFLRFENIAGLFLKSGPAYDHWMRRSFMAARRRLLDAQGDGP